MREMTKLSSQAAHEFLAALKEMPTMSVTRMDEGKLEDWLVIGQAVHERQPGMPPTVKRFGQAPRGSLPISWSACGLIPNSRGFFLPAISCPLPVKSHRIAVRILRPSSLTSMFASYQR